MKRLKQLCYLLLMFLVLTSCTTYENNESTYIEGYIVSSFICDKTDASGQSTGNHTKRGYGILLEDSENSEVHWAIDFYAFNLPEDLFDFPIEILSEGSNSNNCGPVFFPDGFRNTYKIKFQYKVLSEAEKIEFACGPCTSLDLIFPWENLDEISLQNVTKIKN